MLLCIQQSPWPVTDRRVAQVQRWVARTGMAPLALTARRNFDQLDASSTAMYLHPKQQPFAARNDADVLRLVDEYPLAWVIGVGSPGASATPLPLLPDLNDAGKLVSFTGHFSIHNPQVAELREKAEACVLFMGPQGYVSPSCTSQPQWAPTWNYAVARFEVTVEFRPEETRPALERLVARMERANPQPWELSRLGSRYEQLSPRIIAFRAHVQEVRATFKLGQDERRSSLGEILTRLKDPSLVQWMREFNT